MTARYVARQVAIECERLAKAIQENPSIKCANAPITIKILDTLAERAELDPKHVDDIMNLIACPWREYAFNAAQSPNLLRYIDELSKKESETFRECLRCMCMQVYVMRFDIKAKHGMSSVTVRLNIKDIPLMKYIKGSWKPCLQPEVTWGENYPDQKVMIADLLEEECSDERTYVRFCSLAQLIRHIQSLNKDQLRDEIIKEIENYPTREGLIMIDEYLRHQELDPEIAMALVPKMCSISFDQTVLFRRPLKRLMSWLLRNGNKNDLGRFRYIMTNAANTLDSWEVSEFIREYFQHIQMGEDDNKYIFDRVREKLWGRY